MTPPTPAALILAFALYPVVLLMRGVDALRRGWYRLRPRQFHWLEMDGVVQCLREMCATCATSVEWSYASCRSPRLDAVLAENGQFTPATANAIWFRVRPSYVPRELFMRQLHDQMLAQRELFRGSYWQLGCDEQGRLAVQVTMAAVDNREPSRRKRAVVLSGGRGRYRVQAGASE